MPSRVRYSTVTTPEAARLKATGNTTAGSMPSRARASATERSAGPRTVALTAFASFRPASVHTAPGAAQSVAAGSRTVTSSCESGRTEMFQRWFCPGATRFALRTCPLVTSNASSRSSLKRSRPGKSSLKRSSNVNRLFPSCSPGMPTNDAVSGGFAEGGASRQFTLWAGSWPSPACARPASAPVAADRIAPPFAASVLASTAMPRGEVFGSATL